MLLSGHPGCRDCQRAGHIYGATAIPALLDMLELAQSIVSIDAIGCQKSIAARIVEKEADYILALKGNHETLYANAGYPPK